MMHRGGSEPCVHMLLVYHNHVFIHLLPSSCHFVFSPSRPWLYRLLSLILSFNILLYLLSLHPPPPLPFPPPPLWPPLSSPLCVWRCLLCRDETVALTRLTGRLFIGFISIIRLPEKKTDGAPGKSEGGSKDERENRGKKKQGWRKWNVKRGRAGTCLGIGVRLHQCAYTWVCVYVRVDDLGNRRQRRGTDAACCGCICIWQLTIDKANVACYHSRRSQEG